MTKYRLPFTRSRTIHAATDYKSLFFLFLLVCFSGVVFGQGRPITGKVVATDTDSLIAGATVAVKGKNISTMTGKDGSFTLTAPPNSVLQISCIGFLSQEVPVGNSGSVTVHLISSAQSIQQ